MGFARHQIPVTADLVGMGPTVAIVSSVLDAKMEHVSRGTIVCANPGGVAGIAIG